MNRFSYALSVLMLSGAAQAQWVEPDRPAELVEGTATRASATDPTGDNFNPGPDLTGIAASVVGTDLLIDLTFAAPIVSPDLGGGGDEVIGFIDLDLDQSDATGFPGGNVSVFCPAAPAGFGPDAVVNLGSYDPMTGTVEIDDFGTVLGTAPITYGATSVSVAVPLAVLSDDGIADINTVIGNFPAPTDCAPDGVVLTSDFGASTQSVPAMNTLGLVLMAGLLLLLAAAAVRGRGF